jgi:ATP-binding cassette, subfamily B, bacterial MsbA
MADMLNARSKNVYLRMARYVRPYLGQAIFAMACMGMVAAATSGTAYMVKPVMDQIFTAKEASSLYPISIGIVLLFLFKGVFFYLQSYTMSMVGQKAIIDIRQEVVDHLLRQDLKYFSNTSTGNLTSRVWNDITLMNTAATQAVTAVAMHILTIIGLTGMVFYFNAKLAFIAILVFPIAIYPLVRFGQRLRVYTREGQAIYSQMNHVLVEGFTGIRVVKAFNMEDVESERFRAEERSLLAIIRRFTRVKSISFPLMELIGAVGIASIILLGGVGVINGEMTQGDFFSFMAALMMLYDPVKKLNGVNHTIQSGAAAAERVFEIIDTESEVVDTSGAKVIQAVRGEVDFKGVSFRYDPDQVDVLKNINLHVPAGNVTAFVGPSGGGKTTLVNLIPRFFDVTAGAIYVDGVDIREVTQRSLRDHTAVVTQQTFLFNDTIRNNIKYGRPDAPEEEIFAAARAAHAHDFIMGLPEGYESIVGEQGVKLSGGQKQRISIARAILKNAPILILDEATSALDTKAEKEVQKALDNLMVGRTTFVIAHRLSTIRQADTIVTILNGEIVETGSHAALLNQGGEYAKLYQLQFADQEADAAATAEQAAGLDGDAGEPAV